LAGGSAYWTVTTAFDDLNRPVTVVTPDDANGNQTTSYSSNGLTVSVTDPKSRVAQTIKNSQGWTSANTRNLNATGGASASTVLYYYDALGNLTSTSADGVTTSLGYDGRGRKTSMTDADMGAWQYRYNVFGELIWQKDAKGQIVTMVYDALGRMTSRTEAEGATTWTYDTATTGIGKLASVSAPAGVASSSYAETYSYDSLGRPISLMRTIDGVNYQTQTTYDGASRPLRTIYPASVSGSISTRNVYNAFGYLKEIRNYLATDDAKPISQLQGRVYWMADSYAVTGQVNGETYGNGLANDRAFSAVTGRLSRATIDRGSVITAPFFVQDLSYTYDAVGNVSRRQESATGYARDEQFYTSTPGDGYDGLDRLKVHKVVGGATVTVTYDTKGNITNKSDVGNYTYSGINAGPHAVTTAGSNTYTYDAVGNMLTGAGRTQDWTSFNQLKKVTQGSLSSEFAFGAGHERVLQVKKNGSTVTDRTIYVGSLFEKVISASGSLTEYKHYIMGPTGRIAVYTERNDLTKDTRWLHTDGLGSVTVVSDENGKVLKRYTYDAWGKQSTQYTNTGGGITNTAPTTRGFTDHEMLTDYGLIHMNGRVYDPVLGRFLSADPNVDGVEDAQGYNRYSYVGNNPMNATDPSGYFSLKDALKIVAIAVVAWFTAGLALQAWAVISTGSGFVGGLAGALASVGTAAGWAGGGWAIAAGVGAGFGASFAGSLLNGGSVGDAFKAGIIGGIVGGISAGIAGKIGDFAKGHEWFRGAGQHLAHGATQGALTELQGGEFRHGFYAAFASSAASGPIRELMPDSMTGRTAAAAIVGGTASAIGGGKFANGAVTAAFTHLFNDEAHAMMSSMGGSEAGAYYPAGSFGPSDYVDRINAAAFDAYVNVVLVPAAAEVAGAATMWGLFRASALGRVFWNGGEFAKDAAQAHAVATGGTTINMTLGGRILGWAEKILPRSWMKPLWTRSSAYFARGAEGPVDLVRSLRSPPMRPDSVWLTTERPILQSQGNPINPVIKP
jgi:RHS repeat-associated protein